jgi:hypothetical protein
MDSLPLVQIYIIGRDLSAMVPIKTSLKDQVNSLLNELLTDDHVFTPSSYYAMLKFVRSCLEIESFFYPAVKRSMDDGMAELFSTLNLKLMSGLEGSDDTVTISLDDVFRCRQLLALLPHFFVDTK